MPDFRSLTLTVIRHGECEHNVEGRLAGHNDTPLTEAGRAQAWENGGLLKPFLNERPDFFASPLHRASTTMELVRVAAGLPATGYRADRRLMELDMGDHSGLLTAELAKTADGALYKRDPWNYPWPNGESYASFYQRVGRFLPTLTRDAVLVCHGGTSTMIRAHYLGLTPEDCMRYEPPHQGFIRLSGGTEQLVTP